jgi:Pycsar effector protein
MDNQESERNSALFAHVPERNTSDNMLRTAQQHHVALSTMADTKANIIITVSSIVLTISMGRVDQPDVRISVLTLTVFTLLALLLAILAVLPKYRPFRLTTVELPPNFNLLFFGHFAELTRERYMEEVARTLKPDGSIYAAMANDVYSLGTYLAHHKYRYLRLSYICFLTGFIAASVIQLWHLMAS